MAITTSVAKEPDNVPVSLSSSSGLNPGQAAGIVVGIVVGLALMLLLGLFIIRRRRRAQRAGYTSEFSDLPATDKGLERVRGGAINFGKWAPDRNLKHEMMDNQSVSEMDAESILGRHEKMDEGTHSERHEKMDDESIIERRETVGNGNNSSNGNERHENIDGRNRHKTSKSTINFSGPIFRAELE